MSVSTTWTSECYCDPTVPAVSSACPDLAGVCLVLTDDHHDTTLGTPHAPHCSCRYIYGIFASYKNYFFANSLHVGIYEWNYEYMINYLKV